MKLAATGITLLSSGRVVGPGLHRRRCMIDQPRASLRTSHNSAPRVNEMVARYAFIGIWSAAYLWILWSSLAAPPPIDVKDIHVGMIFWMTVLSLPSGLLVALASDFIASFFGSYFSLAWKYHPAFFYFVWSCYFGVGLMQWVLLLLWPRAGARRSVQLID
jgi:hypothetical protein